MAAEDGRNRVVIEGVEPEIDCGRFPIKRVQGEQVVVEADIFTDGHDLPSASLYYRIQDQSEWTVLPMAPLVNDRWQAAFTVHQLGRYQYTIKAWVDHFLTWHHDLEKRVKAGQDVDVQLLIAAQMVESATQRAEGDDARRLQHYARLLRSDASSAEKLQHVFDDELLHLMRRHPDLRMATSYGRELEVVVDPPKAGFSSWYELFPRSAGAAGAHGTFRDVENLLPYVASMGFDVLYFPPIHPIGREFRKGKNNAVTAEPADVGSPWAIGAEEGGHKSIHPALGTLEDFQRLIAAAKGFGIDIALDIAFQVAPDHPYVKEHEEWFLKRPDGTIQYAENPPKKYQDIYPFNFESEKWRELWEELLDVFLYWIDKGVTIFRVDNPHTKALPFWDWVIGRIKEKHPETIFLAEAFTRPKVMYRLAKGGYTQSYTYFTWRRSAWEMRQYFEELTKTEVKEFFRPNAWPNTPDILSDQLQYGGRAAFMGRLVLAATLSANYGIYGPAFELGEHEPREPGSEEYLHSEKYQLRKWDLERPDSLKAFITRVNQIRKTNPALQWNRTLQFHDTTNENLLCYSKRSQDGENLILTVVNMDLYNTQSGFIDLDLEALGLEPGSTYQVHDLLGDARYTWTGSRNYVELNPFVVPAHVFRIRSRRRSERDFETFN